MSRLVRATAMLLLLVWLSAPAAAAWANVSMNGQTATGSLDAPPVFSYDSPSSAATSAANATHARPGRRTLRGVVRLVSGNARAAREVSHAIPEGRLGHIFKDAPGHLADTPASRKLLQGVADDPATTLGADKFGDTWSAGKLDDGSQAWTQTRNGDIVNGGVNPTPRPFNPATGLSRR